MNREQLEAFRRQVEEDYRLDIAAIERLQRRFAGPETSTPIVGFPSGNQSQITETHAADIPSLESRMQPQPDELTGTLRTMFSTYRK